MGTVSLRRLRYFENVLGEQKDVSMLDH